MTVLFNFFSVAINLYFDHTYVQNFSINIIGVNTLNLAFKHTVPVSYQHNHVVLVATDEEIKELKRKLRATGLALDVRPYNRIKHSDDSEALQPGNTDGNGTYRNSPQNYIFSCFNQTFSCRYCSNSCLNGKKIININYD